MPIEFPCTGCGARLRVPDSAAGRKTKCGRCGDVLPVPDPAAPPDPVPVASLAAPEPEPLEPDPDLPPPPAKPKKPYDLAIVGAARPRPADAPGRRAPRAPRGRWRAAAAVALVFGAVLAAVGYFALRTRSANAPAEWRTHDSDAGGFRVELPAAPHKDIAARVKFLVQPGSAAEGTVQRDTGYAVIWRAAPKLRGKVSETHLLDTTAKGICDELALERVGPTESIVVDGFLGLDFAVTAQGQGTYWVRLVITDSRQYFVAVGGSGGTRDREEVRRFLDSFRLTDEDEVAARQRWLELLPGRERVEEERRRAEARLKEEADERRRADEQRAASEARAEKERQAQLRAAREAAFRAAPGLTAPDPSAVPGLILYVSFDDAPGNTVPLWPEGSVAFEKAPDLGPGARGKALYLSRRVPAMRVPTKYMPKAALTGPGTLCGWMKVREPFLFDVVRAAPKSDLVYGHTRLGLTRQPLGGIRAYTWVPTPENVSAPRPPGEDFPNALSAGLPDEAEGWHHVAVTRTDKAGRDRVALYVDGRLVATYPIPGAVPDITDLFIGHASRAPHAAREDFTDNLDLAVAAVDEVCVFDRALTADEVKFLAGRSAALAPPAPARVKLTVDRSLEPVTGMVFDPDRKAVWAVTAVGGYWNEENRPRVDGPKPASQLLRYSYPEFKLTGRWEFAPIRTLSRPAAGSLALDRMNNRIFVQLEFAGKATNLQREDPQRGAFYRFDLNDLPDWSPAAGPPLVKWAARMADRRPWWEADRSLVSSDGEWLYFYDPHPPNRSGAYGSAVVRAPADLSRIEEVAVGGYAKWSPSIWLAPDGKTLKVVQLGKAANNAKGTASGVLDIDTATWRAGTVRDVLGVNWDAPPEFRTEPWKVPIALHPDGRVFAGAKAGVTETVPGANGPTKRDRPVTLAARAFTAVSDDGRYFFASEGETKRNRLVVLDARANATELGALATIEETDKTLIGGPFFVSPDGRFVVFRSGVVVRVDDSAAPPPVVVPPVVPVPGAVAVAPRPRPVQAPSPGEFKGLIFHLDFETAEDGQVIDRVSGKPAGVANKPEPIDGPRGKGLRVTAVGTGDARTHGVALAADRVVVAEGKPFTLAMWVRRPDADRKARLPALIDGRTDRMTRRKFEIGFVPTGALLLLGQNPTIVVQPGPVLKPDEWTHVAVVRLGEGELRVFVNGTDVTVGKSLGFTGPFKFSDLGLAAPLAATTTAHTLDFDEFALFDRALVADELKRLAGRGHKP